MEFVAPMLSETLALADASAVSWRPRRTPALTKREILEGLKRDELIAAVERFELEVADTRRRDLLIDALDRSSKA